MGAAAWPGDPGGHVALPGLGEMLVEDRQGDVGQQRREDAALGGAGLGVPGTPSSERTPAARNAFTNPTTRLSPMRSRTRPMRAVWSISSKHAVMSPSSTQTYSLGGRCESRRWRHVLVGDGRNP